MTNEETMAACEQKSKTLDSSSNGPGGRADSILNRRSILLGSTSLVSAAAPGSGVETRTAQGKRSSLRQLGGPRTSS